MKISSHFKVIPAVILPHVIGTDLCHIHAYLLVIQADWVLITDGCGSVEVTLIRQAHEMGFLTTPYAFNAQEAHAMAMAGADVVVAHMGLTTAGSIGAKTAVSLEDSVRRVQSIADAAHEVNPDVIVLCHGGENFLTLDSL